jgi:hypothetical protein
LFAFGLPFGMESGHIDGFAQSQIAIFLMHGFLRRHQHLLAVNFVHHQHDRLLVQFALQKPRNSTILMKSKNENQTKTKQTFSLMGSRPSMTMATIWASLAARAACSITHSEKKSSFSCFLPQP